MEHLRRLLAYGADVGSDHDRLIAGQQQLPPDQPVGTFPADPDGADPGLAPAQGGEFEAALRTHLRDLRRASGAADRVDQRAAVHRDLQLIGRRPGNMKVYDDFEIRTDTDDAGPVAL